MNAEIVSRLSGGVSEQTLLEVEKLRGILDEQGEKYRELDALLDERVALNKELGKKLDEYRGVLRRIVKDMVAYFESNVRSPENERAMLLELVKLLSSLQD